jgi:hypothetical protein
MKMEIFESKEQYLNMIKAWKQSCKDNYNFSGYDFALYAILRDKDPKQCFASPEKQSKRKLICQGKTGNEAYRKAMNYVCNARPEWILPPFGGILTEDHLIAIRAILKETDNA